jgi:hypothetical protein
VDTTSQASLPLRTGRASRASRAHRRRRPRWQALLIAVTLSLASVATTWATAEPAAARCERQNVPIVMAIPNASVPQATETPLSGTCNGNFTYRGILRDTNEGIPCATLEVYDYRGGPHLGTYVTCDAIEVRISEAEPDNITYLVLSVAGCCSVARFNSGY